MRSLLSAPVDHNLINDIALCILCAWGLAVVAHQLRQPLMLAYLVAGYIIGPQGYQLIKDTHSVETISSLGLILLMFMIGLEIDLKKIAKAGKTILLTAASQIFGSIIIGLAVFLLCGFRMEAGSMEALYLAIAAAVSSTVIIVKILYERRELDSLPGRISLGILVLQDVVVIVFWALQPELRNPSALMFLKILGKVAALVAIALLISRFVLPRLFKAFARLPELVLVGALAWCFGVALLAEALGLSREMGALVAGVAISTFPYTLDVVAKVTSIRDFFITLFFVALGMMIPTVDLKSLGWALVIVVVVVATRFITVTIPLYRMGKGFRASLLPAIHLCALSELSVVIISEGHKMKNVSDSLFGMVSYAFVILSVLASFAISRSEKVMPIGFGLMRWLGMTDLGEDSKESGSTGHADEGHGHGGKRIYLLGFSWTASSLLEELQRRQPEIVKNLAVVDFNPDVHRELRARGVHAIYGDISQRDTLLHAGIADAELILCTLPNTVLKGVTNLRLLRHLRELNATAKIIVHAELCADVAPLYEAGASHVLVTRLVESRELTGIINAAMTGGLGEKVDWLKREVEQRKEVIP